ncbi:MAG: 5'-methylthioadenosine/adenosylhomocysteine nucleosidase [Clostridia bacterium]|nr:5'-methylthioadenosine/adenosylhomocysteine nucleosidase [Clostridia bacterium]
MVGFVIAMAREAEPFIRRYAVAERDLGGRQAYELDIDGTKAVLTVCGVGKVNASYATAALIAAYSPDLIINCGVSGGIGKGLSIGEVIAVKSCVQHDFDTTAFGAPIGFVATVDTVFFPTDDALRKAFLRSSGAREGVAACGDRFVADIKKKNEIVETFGADICDMESGAVAQCCLIANKRYLCVRAVSDLADGHAPEDFPTFVRSASEELCRVISDFLIERKQAGLPL